MRKKQHINKFLLLLSWLYGVVVWFRNKLFDWGVLKSEEFPIPVISVGNITVGGTGKTPHVEYLIHLLKDHYRIAVLSRGYKRKSKGYLLANRRVTSWDIGDEPYQIWKKFPDILVAVDAVRCRGVRNLLDLPKDKRPEIILLDDAYQHRYIVPSLSIVLTDVNRLVYDDALLPAGRLREPAWNIHRANIVIVTKCPSKLEPIDFRVISKHLHLYPYQSLFFTFFGYKNLQPVFEECASPEISLKDLNKSEYSVLLLSGIANPKQFEAFICSYVTSLVKMEYPDHYEYTASDLKKIKKEYNCLSGNKKIIITTEKDAARLVALNNQLEAELKISMYYLPIEVIFHLNQSNQFKQKIVEHVDSFKRNRILD